MKVLLAGCTGFIGKALTQQLVRDGHECFVLVRSLHPVASFPSLPAVHLLSYDEKPSRVDAVVNLIGEPIAGRWSPEKKEKILDSRIVATRDLVGWMKSLRDPPSVSLTASAVGYYGDRGTELITEKTSPDPAKGFLSSVCVSWEEEANLAGDLGVRTVNLRFSNVLDPSGGFLKVMAPMLRFAPFYAPIAPSSFVPWISLGDAVQIIEFAMFADSVVGPINLVAPTPVTNQELYQSLARAKKRLVLGRVPSSLVRLLIGEFAEDILASQRIIPEKIVRLGYKFGDSNLTEYLVRRFGEP